MPRALSKSSPFLLGRALCRAVAGEAGVSRGFGDWEVASFTVSGSVAQWQEVAASVEQEHRRAYQHGFTAEEVARMRAGVVAFMGQAERAEATAASDARFARVQVYCAS